MSAWDKIERYDVVTSETVDGEQVGAMEPSDDGDWMPTHQVEAALEEAERHAFFAGFLSRRKQREGYLG